MSSKGNNSTSRMKGSNLRKRTRGDYRGKDAKQSQHLLNGNLTKRKIRRTTSRQRHASLLAHAKKNSVNAAAEETQNSSSNDSNNSSNVRAAANTDTTAGGRNNNRNYVNQTKISQIQQNVILRPGNSVVNGQRNDFMPRSINLPKFFHEIDILINKNKGSNNNSKCLLGNVGGDPGTNLVSLKKMVNASTSITGSAMETLFNNMTEIELKIWKKLHFRELQCYPLHDYMTRQKNLNPRMRAILFDWMTEVCQEYRLKRETLHLALINVDRYLSIVKNLKRSNLQLVGVASLLIASKVEEIYAPRGSEFVTTTDGAYEVKDIFSMEMKMLKEFDWKITPVTAFSWMNLYMRKLYQYGQLKYLQIVSKSYVEGGTGKKYKKVRIRYQLLKKYLLNKRASNGEHAEKNLLPLKRKIVSGVSIGDVVGPAAFPAMPFEKIMEKIDLLMLDMTSLRFTPSLIVATMLYQFLPSYMPNITKEEILKITKYNEGQIKEVTKWSSVFLRRFYPKKERGPREQQYRNEILAMDYYTMQQHHPMALKQYKQVWDESRMFNFGNSADNKLRVIIHQYQGRSYEYDASLRASIKQLCDAHCKRFNDVEDVQQMVFLNGPYLSENSEKISIKNMHTMTIDTLLPNEAGYTEIYAISKKEYMSVFKSKKRFFIHDMDTVVESKVSAKTFSVEQKECHVFGIKKGESKRNFEYIKHALKKYAYQQGKKFNELIFVVNDVVVDFSSFNDKPFSHFYNAKNKAGSSSSSRSSSSSDNSNAKTPATAKKMVKRNLHNSISNVESPSVITEKTFKVLANPFRDTIIECYSRKYFENLLEDDDDCNELDGVRMSSPYNLVTDEVLNSPKIKSIGYVKNNKMISNNHVNGGDFTP